MQLARSETAAAVAPVLLTGIGAMQIVYSDGSARFPSVEGGAL